MSTTAFPVPLVVADLSGTTDPELGPSSFIQGTALLDPRTPFTFAVGGANPFYSFMDGGGILAADYAPSAVSAVNIAALQHPTLNTAMTLVSSTGAGITVGDSIVRTDTGATVTGLLRIDGTVGYISTSTIDRSRIWDPAKPAIGRSVSLTSTADLHLINFTVKGYDGFGYPVTSTIAGPNNSTVTTPKTFKWVASVTPSASDGVNNVSVGVADIFGLPIRADSLFYVSAFWNEITFATSASLVFTAAVTTSPSTAALGDVRGTLNTNANAGGTASNGTIKLRLSITPSAANISTITGLFGVSQV